MINSTVIACINIIGAILTLTGPIGVIVGLCLIFGVNVMILMAASREQCNKKPPPTDGE
jgi:hypothetical protein